MNFIKASIQISKTLRNITRLKEIILVFARHGFHEFISSGMTNKIPNFVLPKSKKNILKNIEKKNWNQVIGIGLKLSFEELGSIFIKFGQLISSRSDILSKDLVEELKSLKDNVNPIPFLQVRERVQKNFSKDLDQIFEYIEEQPIGTASIGVAYRGKLQTGEIVVLKVKRPGIEKKILIDFSILRFLALQLEKISSEIKFLGLSRIVDDFAYHLDNELDFNIELHNCIRFKTNIQQYDDQKIFYLPTVFPNLSSRNLLVMEYLEGTPFSQLDLLLLEKDLIRNLEEGIKIFIKTLLYDGFFHADLHHGNLFYLKNNRIGLIDFGFMGSLEKRERQNFISIIYAMINFDYENIVFEVLDVAEYSTIPDIERMIRDVKDALSPSLRSSIHKTNVAMLLNKILSAIKKHHIYLPREWYTVFRALATLDSVGKSIGQKFDIHTLFKENIWDIIKGNIYGNQWKEEILWSLKDIFSMAKIIPRHLKWFLKDLSKKRYTLTIKQTGYESHIEKIQIALVFLGTAILSSTVIFTGTMIFLEKKIIENESINLLLYFFSGTSLVLLIYGIYLLKRMKIK